MCFIWKSLHNLLEVLKYFAVFVAPQNIIIKGIYVLAHGIVVETLHAVHWTTLQFLAINTFKMPWFLLCLRTGLLIFSGVLISKNKLMYHRAVGAEGIAAQCMSTTFSPFSHSPHQAQPCFQCSFAVTTSLVFPWSYPWDTLKWYHQMSQFFFFQMILSFVIILSVILFIAQPWKQWYWHKERSSMKLVEGMTEVK